MSAVDAAEPTSEICSAAGTAVSTLSTWPVSPKIRTGLFSAGGAAAAVKGTQRNAARIKYRLTKAVTTGETGDSARSSIIRGLRSGAEQAIRLATSSAAFHC